MRWASMCADRRDRGIVDVCIVWRDGLRGLPEARPRVVWRGLAMSTIVVARASDYWQDSARRYKVLDQRK